MLQKSVHILLKISFHALCVIRLSPTFLMVFHKLWGGKKEAFYMAQYFLFF